MENNLQTMAMVAVAGSEDPRTPPLLHPHHDPHTCDMPLTGSHLGMAPGTPTAGSMVAALTVILAQAAMCADDVAIVPPGPVVASVDNIHLVDGQDQEDCAQPQRRVCATRHRVSTKARARARALPTAAIAAPHAAFANYPLAAQT